MKPHLMLRAPGRSGAVGSQPSVARRWGAASLVLIAACPVEAATDEISPSASVTIEISVSVASRYGLSVNDRGSSPQGPKRSTSREYCLASNGRAMDLPVMLVWSSGGPPSAETAAKQAVQMARCDAIGGPQSFANSPDEAVGMREALVTPE
ncbi:MAG TPA: hypothetical protein VEB39_02750 [Sphingomicrobium sp.]|nr:hypothetical protein [Sphingomicrobium sp.]